MLPRLSPQNVRRRTFFSTLGHRQIGLQKKTAICIGAICTSVKFQVSSSNTCSRAKSEMRAKSRKTDPPPLSVNLCRSPRDGTFARIFGIRDYHTPPRTPVGGGLRYMRKKNISSMDGPLGMRVAYTYPGRPGHHSTHTMFFDLGLG